jgi:Calx-beta domain/CHU_C Type IX secretion signal domain
LLNFNPIAEKLLVKLILSNLSIVMRINSTALFALFFVTFLSEINAQSPNVTEVSAAKPKIMDTRVQRHLMSPDGILQPIILEKLLPGETYMLVLSDDVGLNGCVPKVSDPDGEANLVSKTDGMTYYLTPKSGKVRLNFEYCFDKIFPKQHWVSFELLTGKKTNLKEFMAVLEVEGGYSAEELIKDVIIGGDCFDITNVTFSGVSSQIARFTNGQTSLGFQEGAILCTGPADQSVGPNSSNATGQSVGGGGDSDLTQLAGGGSVFDLCNIEFDFQPTETPLTFQYVFASDEYCEYVGSQFNDRFGFFISGPGISGPFNGAANLAILPGGGTYVGINSVNHTTNTGFFKNNLNSAVGNNCAPMPDAGQSANELEWDGLTAVMTAVANVIPCSTYHIKLKIGDVGDGVFDSAVFLKSGSFDAGGNAALSLEVDGNPDDDTATEGCDNAKFIFTRVGTNLNSPIVVNYTISGTATSGLDYSAIPGVISIPSGQTMAMIPVNVLNDALAEGIENIRIRLLHPCSCLEPFLDLFIEDYVPMEIMSDTIFQCGPGVVNIEPTVTGGNEPYMYSWSNGGNTSNITPFVNSSSGFNLTVTDDCGKTKTKKTWVSVYPPPMATAGGQAFLCDGSGTANITINFTGGGPWNLTYSQNGIIQDPIEGITVTPYILVVDQPGIYSLVDCTNADGCDGSALGVVTVLNISLSTTGIVTNVTCGGTSNGAINTTVTGGSQPTAYKWSPVQGNVADPINLAAGTYNLTVTDGHGCTDLAQFVVLPGSNLAAATTSIVGANCAQPTGGSVTVLVSGGAPTYQYLWSNGSTSNPLVNVAPGNFTLTITDAQGCTTFLTAAVPGDFAPPTAVAIANGQITCQSQIVPLSGLGSSVGGNFTYQWTTIGGAFSGPINQLDAVAVSPGTYAIVVTNTLNGCTATNSVIIPGSSDIPAAIASAPNQLNCLVSNTNLSGAGSATGANFIYLWTGAGLTGGETTLTPSVNAAGTYTLLVTNSVSGCTNTSQVVLMLDNQAPNAIATTPSQLNCANLDLVLNGIGSSAGANFTYNWTTLNGNIQSGATSLQPIITLSGNYQLVVTNQTNGCTASASTSVTQDLSVPIAQIAPPATLTCATTQFDLNAAGSSFGGNFNVVWTTANGNFISGINTLNPVISQTGNYILTITNLASQCTATANTLVLSNTVNPIANAGLPQTITCATNSLVIGGVNSQPNVNLTYFWDGVGITAGQNTSTPTVNAGGTFYLTVTDVANGCTAASFVLINENTLSPTVLVAPGGQLTCQTTSISLDAGGSSAGNEYNYVWTASAGGSILSGGNTQNPVVSTAGNYALVITNATNNCSATAATSVTQSIGVPTAIAVADGPITCMDDQVFIDATGSTTGADIAYQWSTIDGQIIGNTNNLQITAGSAGSYSLLIWNSSNNCQIITNVVVGSDLTPPIADAGAGATLSCGTPSANLNGGNSSAGANFDYLWTTLGGSFTQNSNLTSISPTATAAGNYTILVTNNQNGCTATDNVIINQSPDVPIAAIANPAVLTCSTISLNLNGVGSSVGADYTYLWTTTNGQISAGATTISPTIIKPGVYQLAVTDVVKGCTALSSVTVLQNITPPDVQAGPPGLLTCATNSTSLTGSVLNLGNFSYQWTTTNGQIQSGATTLTPSVSAAGSYILQVTNTQNGCSATAIASVTSNTTPPIAVIATPPVLTCIVADASLDASGSSQGQFSYNWAASNGGAIANTLDPIHPVITNPGNYSLTVTNNLNNCTATTSTTVIESVNNPTVLVAPAAILTCVTTNLTLSGAGSSSGSNFSYAWTTAGTGVISGGASTISPTITAPGTYTLTVKNSQNGCSASAFAVVSQNITPPTVIIGTPNQFTCTVNSVTLSGVGSQSGAGITYLWTTNNGQISIGNTTLSPTISKAGIYNLQIINATNGCSATANVTVLQNITPPTADAGIANQLNCSITTVNLQGSASAQTSVAWTTQVGNILSGTTTLSPTVNQAGIYTMTVTSLQNGCTALDNVTVTAQTSQPTDFTINLVIPSCQGNGSVNFTNVIGGVAPFIYSIDGGQNWVTGASFTNIAPGNYDLFVQDVNGCEYNEPLIVPAPAIPTISMIPEIQLNFGDSLTLDVQINPDFPLNQTDTVIWTPTTGLTFAGNSVNDLLHPSVRPFQNTKYTVTLISLAGCKTTASTYLKVDRDPHVYIPNVISPWNNDKNNDQLIIFADNSQVLEISAFQMFDRWGAKIWSDFNFQPNEPAHGWTTLVRNKKLNPGVFVYWATIKFIDGRTVLYKGDVTIVK